MSTTTKITERDVYTAILDGTIDMDNLKAFAEKKLAQLDKRNESARKRAEKKRVEGDALRDAICAILTDEPVSREDIYASLEATGEYEDLKLGSITFRLNDLVKQGMANKVEASVVGSDGKPGRRVMVYTKI